MAPSRTKRTSDSTSGAGPSKGRSQKQKHHPYASKPRHSTQEDALPGVQKLKAALRQTKRLLAKENLAANVRVETERRMKALEADLAKAEETRKERNFAVKYHRVKFFERQKLVRKINQTKRSLATFEGKEKKKLETTLNDLRVDLNYIMHYPKTKKYVSLFPPEVRQSDAPSTPAAAISDDNDERSKVRAMIRERMERGELGTEPENDLGKSEHDSAPSRSNMKGTATVPPKKSLKQIDDVAGDDFFGNDDDDEDSQQSEDSDADSG
ncbi:hypothetical protein HYDPIDRAFT_187107 [Hydnomerulius pinastri MD-312]|nr:hypothetical protein HYDPIDRAFT_187107 [Hydnomerulius pinastri MD-312]